MTGPRDSGRNPRQTRLRAIVAILAATLLTCSSAAAEAPPRHPTPEQLWHAYPLDPKPAETHAATTVEQPPAAETHAATTVERAAPAITHADTKVAPASPAQRTSRPQAAQPARAPEPEPAGSGASAAVVAAATAGALALVLVIAALVFVVNGSDASPQRPRRRGDRTPRGRDLVSSPVLAVDDSDLSNVAESRPTPSSPEVPSEVDVLRAKQPSDSTVLKSEREFEADVDVLKAKREHRDREIEKTGTAPDLDMLMAKRSVEPPPKVEAASAEVVEADVLRAKREETPTDTIEALISKLKPAPDAGDATPKPALVAVSNEPASFLPRRTGRRARAGMVERCTVHWWRGHVKSEFYATTEDGEARPIATSPSFRWRKSEPPPDRGAPTKALAALVEQLEADGWRAVGRGNDWYALRFRRRPRREGGYTDTSN